MLNRNEWTYLRTYECTIWISESVVHRSTRGIFEAAGKLQPNWQTVISFFFCRNCNVLSVQCGYPGNDTMMPWKKKEEKILSYWHYTCTRSQVQSLIVAKKLTRKLLPTIRFSSICYHRHNQGDLFFSEHFKKILDVSTDVTGRQGNERDGISSL